MTKTFRDLGVAPALCDELTEQGITHPFPIQELTLPLALEGHDLIGQARTGTGKTLAFGLPLLQRLDPGSKRTQALVIVPTRELCLQVFSDLQIGHRLGLTSVSVYGGVGYDEQIEALQAGAHVVVGTPGRLLDLFDRGVLDLAQVTQLVLDEADEMLDMGFLPDVERLVEGCTGPDRHTMLFSATMPTAIVKLARRYMDHPTFTRADHEQKNTAPLVTQYFFEVHRMDKPRLLARILQSRDRGGVYVFVRTKHMADRLVNDLEELHIPSIAIHGDLRQSTRERNLDRFRSGEATVLVCTEVAARGLDVTGVTHVVNYDCPEDEKMYLHRIGRTARAGEAGVAITFAEFNEIDRLNVIRKAVGATETSVRQVFSTSKELTELFDLPEERPWDHLTTKAGSDEARSRRESRSDGRPKSPRTQEGRGGDHDARRSGRRTPADPGKRSGAGRRATTADPRSGSAAADEREPDARQPDARQPDARQPEARRADGPERSTRQPDAREPETATTTEGAGTAAAASTRGGAGASARASARSSTRTRTRTRSRTRTGTDATATERDEVTGSSSSRSRGRGRTDADHGTTEPSTADRDDRGERDRGDRDTASSRADTGSTGGEPGSTGGRRRARPGQRRGRAAAEEGTITPGDGGEGTATEADGRSSNDRNGNDRSGNDRSRNDRGRQDSGSKDRSKDDAGREDAGRGPRSGSRSRSRGERGRSERGRGATAPRNGDRARGSRDEPRGERDARGGGGDPTIRVAERGEEARGDGQPQVSRRVKVEHLP